MLLCVAIGCSGAFAQSTQSILFGLVYDSREGIAVGAATVQCLAAGALIGETITDADGKFVMRDVTPGVYTLRAGHGGYQSREIREVSVPVAGYLSFDFRLRPLTDVWEHGTYRNLSVSPDRTLVTYFGPDVERNKVQSVQTNPIQSSSLEATLSHVVDRRTLLNLPLTVRDPYTLLVLLPGVSSDTGTSRGLGFSVNGQRPASSHFLLDGFDNDNQLVTGPLISIPPEAVQEYRVSTHNFAAEFGRTTGFVANVISLAPQRPLQAAFWHYRGNEALNANGFQQNRQGIPRALQRESNSGGQLLAKLGRRAAVSATVETLVRRGQRDPVTLRLPGPQMLSLTAPGSTTRRLLTAYPHGYSGTGIYFDREFRPPITFERGSAIFRGDSTVGIHRMQSTFARSAVNRPDFVWTPYTEFNMALQHQSARFTGAVTTTRGSRWANTFRFAAARDDLRFDRPLGQIPTLASYDGLVLPGSPAFYSFRNLSRYLQITDNLEGVAGRHIWKGGATVLLRRIDGYLTAGQDGLIAFQDFFDVALDRPAQLSAAVARNTLPALVTPQFGQAYTNRQFSGFFQDSFRASPNVNLHAGLRYESFGAPNAHQAGDLTVNWRTGLLDPADRRLYAPDRNNWAARVGLVLRLAASSKTVVRASYGTFYDRPFDNLWQNLRSNRFVLAGFPLRRPGYDYLRPISEQLQERSGDDFVHDFPNPTAFAGDRRDGYLHSGVASLTREISGRTSLELHASGSSAHKLVTSDLVNRPVGGIRPLPLPLISYRSSAGASSYRSLLAVLRTRSRFVQLQTSYSWSRAQDVQSDALLGDFFNLDFTRLNTGTEGKVFSAFSRQGDSRADRGNADFDQRHSAVLFSTFELPPLLWSWRVGAIAALRSGLPYSVLSGNSGSAGEMMIINNRADLVADPYAGGPIDGGRQVLNPNAFRDPAPGTLGNSGRNAFRSSPFFNMDLSVGREFVIRAGDERIRLHIRLDLQNALNRANLDKPDNLLTSPAFGQAPYGRQGVTSGFPALIPLDERPRQLFFYLHLQF